MGKLLAIDIGCGKRPVKIEGYDVKTLDIRGEVNPDIIAPIDNIPVPDESFDLAFSCHVLEHVKRADVHNTLKEWRRILKVGGKLELVLPDLEVAAIELLTCKTHKETFDILWGEQDYVTSYHYSGYTWQLLEATVKKYGFEVNSVKCVDRQIFLSATKLAGEYLL